MAIFKCKMCGGELNLMEDSNVCDCEYCGTTQTVPSADNEKKMSLFSRANRLLFLNDFDKASGVYESIVAEFPEEAEAYWGLVLCKYGIEYVDDPVTQKKIPTCHRSSFDSVMDDTNFDLVMEYADSVALGVYRREAKQIEEIRKGIIEVSSKEEPYDIFICYKETDDKGDRTIDSLIAQDTYDALTEKGYRVFFSRITLEDKLGQEYEPYIFAALNSAKVMLAFGTDYTHYNAVWVKNEWSRFLQLVSKGEKKTLIPCYKDIDAYDMPKEFAKLQAQDMGKVGALQDLVRGIEKIIPLDKEPAARGETIQVVQSVGGVPVASLLERVEMFLEESNWKSVDEYIEKVLDSEPKNAKAYLYKTCRECKVTDFKRLVNGAKKFEELESFQKAVRFADDDFKTKLEQMVAEAKRLREEKRNAGKVKVGPIQEIFKDKNCPVSILCSEKDERKSGFLGIKSDGSVMVKNRSKLSGWKNIVAIFETHSKWLGITSEGKVVGDSSLASEWEDIVSIVDIDYQGYAGIKADGSVVLTGNVARYKAAKKWEDIIEIASGYDFIVGLKSDGTAVAIGNEWARAVTEWRDLVSVDCGSDYIVGLKSDGTVVYTGCEFDASFWEAMEDILSIDEINEMSAKPDVSSWKDIVSISCTYYGPVGVKVDGTVVLTFKDRSNLERKIKDWTDIIFIDQLGYEDIIGLKSDGTVVSTLNKGTEEWCDIVYVSGNEHMVTGIKSDGKVVVSSYDILGWTTKTLDWKMFNDLEDLKQATERNKQNKVILAKRCKEKEIIRRKELEENQRLEAEVKKKEAERKAAEEKLRAERRAQGVCQHCGGELKGLLTKKCVVCGKPKDYV